MYLPVHFQVCSDFCLDFTFHFYFMLEGSFKRKNINPNFGIFYLNTVKKNTNNKNAEPKIEQCNSTSLIESVTL